MLNTTETNLWQLHVRSAKGDPLSNAEQEQLAAWYTVQEQAEKLTLQGVVTAYPSTTSQAQVDLLLAQIAATTARIKQLTDENVQLRQEIAQLRRQLTKSALLQPA